MLNMAVRNTNKLIREMSRTNNVRMGRFFTKKADAARMAALLCPTVAEGDAHALPSSLRLLDAGAGTGILAAAALEALCRQGGCSEILLTCYENDPIMLPMLLKNTQQLRLRCRRLYHVKVTVDIRARDFLDDFAEEPPAGYHMAILNPPSLLLHAHSPQVQAMGGLCAGETDAAFLFAYRCLQALTEGGRLVVMLPTAFADSTYLRRLRGAMLEQASLSRLLLLEGNKKSGGRPELRHLVLSMIKGQAQKTEISLQTVAADDTLRADLTLPASTLVRGSEQYLILPRDMQDMHVLNTVEAQKNTLATLGLCVRTGLTLPSRYAGQLRAAPTEGAVPLLHPRGMQNGRMVHPLGFEQDYVIPVIPSLARRNKNMLLIKRVPAKSDGRHIVAAAYTAVTLPRAESVSTNNKLNYIDCIKDSEEIPTPLLYGLLAVLSSSLYENYICLVCGKRQMNASYFDDLPLPDKRTLCDIGARMTMVRRFTPKTYDDLTEPAFSKKRTSW